jgi:hypothetical protein
MNQHSKELRVRWSPSCAIEILLNFRMRYRTGGLTYTVKSEYYYDGHRYLVDVCIESSVYDSTFLIVLILLHRVSCLSNTDL